MKTLPNARALNPGGKIQGTVTPSLLDSEAKRANPQNFPDSFTENIMRTFLDSRNALLNRPSLAGGVLQTPLSLEISMFSAKCLKGHSKSILYSEPLPMSSESFLLQSFLGIFYREVNGV